MNSLKLFFETATVIRKKYLQLKYLEVFGGAISCQIAKLTKFSLQFSLFCRQLF